MPETLHMKLSNPINTEGVCEECGRRSAREWIVPSLPTWARR